ncbi:tetratricopeptide repeat protein [bacterium]|nr:MAG: tetratricopeptide repeat protein [bacterium]
MMTSTGFFENGKRLFVEGKLKESIEEFTKAIDAGEKSEIAFLSRGVAHLKNHETDQAINDFSEAVKMNDNNFRAHYYRGISYLTKEDYEDAIADFDKTIELTPENVAAYFARGTAYAHMGDEKEATKSIKTAIMSSETNIMELSESIGLWRTQFDKTISIMSGEKKPIEMTLTEDEIKTLKKWADEGYRKATLH